MYANGKGLAWHKRQQQTLHDIISDGLAANDVEVRAAFGQQFVGAVRAISGSKIPAYHRGLLAVICKGMDMFALSDNAHVLDAYNWVKGQKKRVKAKPAASATRPASTGQVMGAGDIQVGQNDTAHSG